MVFFLNSCYNSDQSRVTTGILTLIYGDRGGGGGTDRLSVTGESTENSDV